MKPFEKDFKNVAKHIENVQQYGLPLVVALNEFVSDTKAEQELFASLCQEFGVPCIMTAVWEKGSKGGIELAQKSG